MDDSEDTSKEQKSSAKLLLEAIGDLRRLGYTIDDKSLLDDLIKLSSTTSTTPLYETVSPSGETVTFTPADLVVGRGRLRDSKGKKFNPTRRRGKSLADRVMSPGYGKVRKG
jgi:hypothetical protein